jgi:hypothetical protein
MEAAVNVMCLDASTAIAGRFIIMRRNIYSYLECNWRLNVAFLVDLIVLLLFWWSVAADFDGVPPRSP